MIYIVDTNNKTFYLTPENINFFFKKPIIQNDYCSKRNYQLRNR